MTQNEFDKILDTTTSAIDSPIDKKAILFWDIATDEVLLEDSVLLSDEIEGWASQVVVVLILLPIDCNLLHLPSFISE